MAAHLEFVELLCGPGEETVLVLLAEVGDLAALEESGVE